MVRPALSFVLLALFAVPAFAADVATLDIATLDLVYSRATDQLYASVPAAGGEPHRVIAIDRHSRTVVHALEIPSQPGPLALTSDERSLYVGLGLDGAGRSSIQRIELPGLQRSFEFSVTNPAQPPRFPADIAVDPDRPDTVAVSLARTRSARPGSALVFAALVVYDGGVPRGEEISDVLASRIEYGQSGRTLYGYNRQTSAFGFSEISVSAQGPQTLFSRVPGLFRGFQTDIHFSPGRQRSLTGRLFGTNGDVLIPSPDFLIPSPAAGGILLPNTFKARATSLAVSEFSSGRQIAFLQLDPPRIEIFDVATATSLRRIAVPRARGSSSLAWISENEFAYRTPRHIVFVR